MDTWLNCTIAKGMFSDEFTAVIRTLSGDLISVFVPKSSVEEKRHRVRVRIMRQSGQNFAILPNENQTVVDVDPVDLMPA